MTQDDIIRMALEAGGDWDDWEMTREFLVAFAKKVAAHEREECAKLCEKIIPVFSIHDENTYHGFEKGTLQAARAIRARGEK